MGNEVSLSRAIELTETQKELLSALTPFQKRLVAALIKGLKDLEAYREAQPSSNGTDVAARVTVNKTKKKPKVKAFLDSIDECFITEAIMTKEEAMERLTILGRANLGAMCDFKKAIVGFEEKSGDPIYQSVWAFKDSVELDDARLATISELNASAQGLKIKLHGPVQAIQQLGLIQGWQKPAKLDHSSKDGSMTPKPGVTLDVSGLSDAAIAEILEASDAATKSD